MGVVRIGCERFGHGSGVGQQKLGRRVGWDKGIRSDTVCLSGRSPHVDTGNTGSGERDGHYHSLSGRESLYGDTQWQGL